MKTRIDKNKTYQNGKKTKIDKYTTYQNGKETKNDKYTTHQTGPPGMIRTSLTKWKESLD